jgi:hypothetical protein
VPAYLGPAGWLGLDLDERTDLEEVGELLEDSFRLTAPARLVATLDRQFGVRHRPTPRQFGHPDPSRLGRSGLLPPQLAERKTEGEAMRALKRQLSDVVYRRLLADQRRREAARGGQRGTRLASA